VRLAAVVLLLLLPVGAVFGYLSTRGTVRRVRRLEQVTGRMAAGDLDQQVPVAGRDELTGLETGFNTMAAQLRDAMEAERQLSETAARTAERTRIARDLHDSVSQDLFSLGLLAGGLRKALPDGSPLREEVDALERTSRRAQREMQALLLELRPVPGEDVGLTEALDSLCAAYRARLGVEVRADVATLDASPAVEHGVLRLAQEAMANAVRHGGPDTITLEVGQVDGTVHVRVHDDGAGFDAAELDGRPEHGLGLRSMRDRVDELGGRMRVDSTIGEGTTVTVDVPAGAH
jgi:signal transduction histidine kinase